MEALHSVLLVVGAFSALVLFRCGSGKSFSIKTSESTETETTGKDKETLTCHPEEYLGLSLFL